MFLVTFRSRKELEDCYCRICEFAKNKCGIDDPLSIRFPDWEDLLDRGLGISEDAQLRLKIEVKCQIGLDVVGVRFMITHHEMAQGNEAVKANLKRFLSALARAINRKKVEQAIYDDAVWRWMPTDSIGPRER